MDDHESQNGDFMQVLFHQSFMLGIYLEENIDIF